MNNYLIDEKWIQNNNIRLYKAFDIYKKNNNNEDVFMFFLETLQALVNEKVSMFGCRVKCDNFYCEYNVKQNIYDIHIITDIVSDTQQLVLSEFDFHMFYPVDKVDIENLQQFSKELIECTFNGFLITVYEKEDIIKKCYKFLKFENPPVFKYECDTCHEEFHSADEFLQHLKDTKHKDSIYQQFGYWEGVKL